MNPQRELRDIERDETLSANYHAKMAVQLCQDEDYEGLKAKSDELGIKASEVLFGSEK